MKRHVLVCGLLLGFLLGAELPTYANNGIDKATYDRAIDYLNCRIAELSVKDQPGQPHLTDFAAQTKSCDLDAFKGDFYQTLQSFYAKRPLAKSQQLAAFIQTFKTRYQSDYNSTQLFKFVVDTLMNEAPIQAFAQRHSVTYPGVETDLSSYVYNLFQNTAPHTPPNPNDALVGNDRTFGNDTADTYIHQDGGAANDELIVEEEPNLNGNDLYDKALKPWWYTYRWLLIVGSLSVVLFILAWRFRWWQQLENRLSSRQLSPAQAAAFQQLQQKMVEVENQNINLQEEISILRQRILAYEQKANSRSDFEEAEYEEVEDNPPRESFTWVDEQEATTIVASKAIDLDELTTGDQFFLPIPDPHGIFDSTKANAHFQRLQSAYKFTVTSSDGQQAHFQLVDDIATIVRALENYDEYIRPACRTTVIPPKIATRVITEDPGLAIRNGKEWHLVSKAVIRCV